MTSTASKVRANFMFVSQESRTTELIKIVVQMTSVLYVRHACSHNAAGERMTWTERKLEDEASHHYTTSSCIALNQGSFVVATKPNSHALTATKLS